MFIYLSRCHPGFTQITLLNCYLQIILQGTLEMKKYEERQTESINNSSFAPLAIRF